VTAGKLQRVRRLVDDRVWHFSDVAALTDGRKAHAVYDRSDFRRVYNQWNGPIDATPRALDRFDASRPGGDDPSLNPSGS
jgi:hypothetical protein